MNEVQDDLFEFCLGLPKIELHAHINGSISKDTMKKLIKMKTDREEFESNISEEMTLILDGEQKTLEECFSIFKVVHKIVDNPEAVYIATKEVIREFANDGVKYLELRSTPKSNCKMTKEAYMNAVVKAINECNHDDKLDVITRFLVSIDRRNGQTVAEQTVDLAKEYQQRNDCILGIDLSGDPSHGKSADFVPALQNAKSLGLKTAVHLAETEDEFLETLALLNVMPDRVGHGTFLLPEDGGHKDFVEFMTKNHIPLELCLTSNVKGRTVANYDAHHFKKWYDLEHPCVICTDDKGVFDTSLSKEYFLAAEAFRLDKNSLWNLSESAIDCIFASDSVKKGLKSKWNGIKEILIK